MPWYLEKRLVFLVPAGVPGYPDQGLPPVPPGYPDQGLPPISPGYPDQGLPGVPPAVWPRPPLYPDQGLPGGGWRPPVYPGQGLPVPPAIWPRPPLYPDQGLPPLSPGYPDQGLPGRPGRPVYPDQGLPGGGVGKPPVYAELPDDVSPPSSPPAGPPDMASPGHWATIVIEGAHKPGFIQTAISADPEHEAKPPTKGLPGEWVPVYNVETSAAAYAWLPTKPVKPDPKPEPKATRA